MKAILTFTIESRESALRALLSFDVAWGRNARPLTTGLPSIVLAEKLNPDEQDCNARPLRRGLSAPHRNGGAGRRESRMIASHCVWSKERPSGLGALRYSLTCVRVLELPGLQWPGDLV
jgi:hypothetical protein